MTEQPTKVDDVRDRKNDIMPSLHRAVGRISRLVLRGRLVTGSTLSSSVSGVMMVGYQLYNMQYDGSSMY